MSPDAERFRSPLQTLRTRLVMAGVFLGALIALALSVTFSWSGSAEGGAGGGSGKLSPAAQEAFHSPPGSCLNWSNPDAGDARKIDCAQPHLFEVSSIVDLGAEYPEGAPSPSTEQWQQISQSKCSAALKPYLGHELDPYGKLTLNLLRPTAPQWADGDRQLRCGLQWAGPGGKLQPTTGPAKSQNQSLVWEPGTCLALLGKSVGDPIDCAKPHAYEIVAKLDLKTKFTDGYPSQDDQKAWLDTECSNAVTEYTGGADLGAKKLILTWDVREQESWDAGSTQVNCKVAAKLPDGSGLDAITGSLKAAPGTGGDGPPADGGGRPNQSAPPSAPKTGSPTSASR
ncbi:septum formation family protein [Amycolatopsis sp. H20-H5]|uniref:septum formation family protein n=1 Tax=Amycolatopsis sp. H20-H5 TaxID=3046309 RepID=UPI002DBE3175|nr:septum formation family protein [Amycolatopsis sp. H20-H5]MEC3977991.1 septum formation family protein [Amycolatopsis sp. H20-H5]